LKVLIADYDYADVDIERRILEGAGLEVVEARCRTEGDVIEAGRGASALLTQYALITARVMDELPELRMVAAMASATTSWTLGPPASGGCGWPMSPTTAPKRWRPTR
jgi:phosphoglycerate dehydrogenase-like enzyme